MCLEMLREQVGIGAHEAWGNVVGLLGSGVPNIWFIQVGAKFEVPFFRRVTRAQDAIARGY